MSKMETMLQPEVSPMSNFPTPDFGERFRMPGLPGTTADVSRPIEFAHNLGEAVKEAQKTGKPVVVIFEEDNCGWCKRFDSELSKQAAANLSGEAIFVKASPSKDPQAAALAKNLGVDSYPTVSVLNVSGTGINERTRMIGYMTADDFANRFHQHGQTQMA